MKFIEKFPDVDSLTDKELWQWVVENQDKGIIVYLDNDDTFIAHNDCDECHSFWDYLGWSDGVVSLLEFIGINATQV